MKYDNSDLCGECNGGGRDGSRECCKACKGTGLERRKPRPTSQTGGAVNPNQSLIVSKNASNEWLKKCRGAIEAKYNGLITSEQCDQLTETANAEYLKQVFPRPLTLVGLLEPRPLNFEE